MDTNPAYTKRIAKNKREAEMQMKKVKKPREFREYIWMTPAGELLVLYETLTFNKAAFKESQEYHPICSSTLLFQLGCRCLGEL